MYFRSEIEGLRAIALLSVVLFHAGFKEFSGGFLGVDIFFVISGYLNTKIIIAELQQNKFSIINFYERRIKRILPMLYLVMFICIPFAWLMMLPDDINFFAKSLVTTSAFVSNLFFLHNGGYFDVQERLNPLLATWSIAVEIQFYFLLPFFLMKIWRLSKRWIFVILGIGLLISFLLMQWVSISNQSAAFYLLPTRIWEFVFGIYAAFFLSKAHPKKIKGSFIGAAGWLGAALILLAIFTYDNKTSSTSIYQLAATFGTVLIILFTTRQTSAGKAIGNKVFVGIGLISYSAYLWHQPVFVFYRYQYFQEPNFNNYLFLISFVFILAYISWRFVEMPLRKNDKFKRSNIFILSFTCSVFFIILGSITVLNKNTVKSYWLNHSSIINHDFNNMLLEKNLPVNESDIKLSNCNFSSSKLDSEIEKKLKECFTSYGPGVLIIGDSHAKNLFGVINSRFDSKFIVSLAHPGCRPYIFDAQCNYDKITSFLSKNGKIFSLLFYEQSGAYLFIKGKKLKGVLFNKSSLLNPRDEIDYDSINEVFIYLNNLAKFTHVKWLMPRIDTEIYRDAIIRKNLGCEYPYSPSQSQILKYKLLDGEIKNIGAKSQNNKILLISQNDLFDFKFPADFLNCKEIYWSDSDHFSNLGEIRFGKRLPKNFLDVD